MHWLATKMPAENDKIPSEIELVQNLTEKWPKEQKKWDAKLNEMIGRNKIVKINKYIYLNNSYFVSLRLISPLMSYTIQAEKNDSL